MANMRHTRDRVHRPGFPSENANSGPEKGVITKGVFSPEESLEPLKSLNSLESLENDRILLCFPQSGNSLKSLESLGSLDSLENGLFLRRALPKGGELGFQNSPEDVSYGIFSAFPKHNSQHVLGLTLQPEIIAKLTPKALFM